MNFHYPPAENTNPLIAASIKMCSDPDSQFKTINAIAEKFALKEIEITPNIIKQALKCYSKAVISKGDDSLASIGNNGIGLCLMQLELFSCIEDGMEVVIKIGDNYIATAYTLRAHVSLKNWERLVEEFKELHRLPADLQNLVKDLEAWTGQEWDLDCNC